MNHTKHQNEGFVLTQIPYVWHWQELSKLETTPVLNEFLNTLEVAITLYGNLVEEELKPMYNSFVDQLKDLKQSVQK